MPLLNSAFSRKATFFMCLGPLRFPLPGFFSTPGGITTAAAATSEDSPDSPVEVEAALLLADEVTEDGGGL